MENDVTGVLIIDKDMDFTSFDVVAIVRGLTKTKKIGHTGTLDPMATGVLPILIGRATRAEAILPDTDKEYCAGFRLGITTDTQDSTGTVLTESDRPVSRKELEEACAQFRGDILQVPPMYSALKKDGVKLVDLARKGVEVEREARPITIFKLEIESYSPETRQGTLRVACSKGTYIRTLCEDIGNTLGCGGIMTSLRRTQAAGFTLEDSITIAEAKRLKEENSLADRILPVERLFAGYPRVTVTEKQAQRFQNGGALDLERLHLPESSKNSAILRVIAPGNRFLGVGEIDVEGGQLKVLRLFF